MTQGIKTAVSVIGIVIIGGIAYAFYNQNSGTSAPAPTPTPTEIPNEESETVSGLTVPEGFALSIFAEDLPGARVLAQDGDGNIWVSQTSRGVITKIEIGADGKPVRQDAVFRNLNRPHGIVIDGNTMYFAEETKITRVALNSDDRGQKIADLPAGGGGHFTRTLLLGPDDRLYVSIGSTCNVCNEEDERNAAIYSMNKDGTDFKQVAKGLRNSVFMATSYVDGRIFATENGRDNLGDNIPPDEINIIEPGKNYGWPICYGKNIHDTNFDKNTYIRNPCMEPFETPSFIDLQAHSAPLGLAFVPEEGWPEDMWYDLLVAYHGSWNRTVPTGYKIVRLKLDARGNYSGTEDFITGWLPANANDGDDAIGRPVDIMLFPGGSGYISDDKAGVIYKLSRTVPAM